MVDLHDMDYELVKDIMAMANTEGGYLIIGVSEVGGGFRLDGVSVEQARIVREIFAFIGGLPTIPKLPHQEEGLAVGRRSTRDADVMPRHG